MMFSLRGAAEDLCSFLVDRRGGGVGPWPSVIVERVFSYDESLLFCILSFLRDKMKAYDKLIEVTAGKMDIHYKNYTFVG